MSAAGEGGLLCRRSVNSRTRQCSGRTDSNATLSATRLASLPRICYRPSMRAFFRRREIAACRSSVQSDSGRSNGVPTKHGSDGA